MLKLTAFEEIIRLASPLLLKIDVFSTNNVKISVFNSSLLILYCGTPSKTARNVSESNFFKSSDVDFPNKMFDARIAFSNSFLPCTLIVISSAMFFCKLLK